MTTRKKIDWSKPIQYAPTCMHFKNGAQYLGETKGRPHECGRKHLVLMYTSSGEAFVTHVDDFGEGVGCIAVENVPEKFGRWVVIYQEFKAWGEICGVDSSYATKSEALAVMKCLQSATRKAFIFYVCGSDGDVIGGEDE